MSAVERRGAVIERVRPVIGLEVHVELSTRSKMFTGVGSPGHAAFEGGEPNSLIDPLVLGLPGSLPVINARAVELSALVGLALGCEISRDTRWDRKQYFYPDLPKAYQISQYALPVCFDGAVDWPIVPPDEGGSAWVAKRVRIERAHLEEDAGKLMHEAPADMPELRPEMRGGGGRSIVDLNRAGTPLLEIVTAPDFSSAAEVGAFCQMLRRVCRFVGATGGDMQKGHMRFEPNINCVLELGDGRRVVTPISEVKNLNSFRAVEAAIGYELRRQPERWREEGAVFGPGSKATYGWDDARQETVLQRSKEDAHDYRYFPDPDLPPIFLDEGWIGDRRAELPELPHDRAARYREAFGLDEKAALALSEERAEAELFDGAARIAAAETGADDPADRGRAGKQAANVLLQGARAIANERGVGVGELGLSAAQIAGVAALRAGDEMDSASVGPVLERMMEAGGDARDAAEAIGALKVLDAGALEGWVDAVLNDPANAQAVADVRDGKQAAIGRLIGGVMKASGGKADAKAARAVILEKLGV